MTTACPLSHKEKSFSPLVTRQTDREGGGGAFFTRGHPAVAQPRARHSAPPARPGHVLGSLLHALHARHRPGQRRPSLHDPVTAALISVSPAFLAADWLKPLSSPSVVQDEEPGLALPHRVNVGKGRLVTAHLCALCPKRSPSHLLTHHSLNHSFNKHLHRPK